MVKITNYQNGKIYVITSKLDRTVKYVGSTCNSLSMRLAHHRGASKVDKNMNLKIYKYFNENGWANAEISLLETCPCKNKMELLMKEREWKDKLVPCLNIYNPFTTDDEKKQQVNKWFKEHPEYIKEYYNENKDKIKKYYNENKDKILPRIKQYQNKHKDKIKQYQNEHKDKINQYQKQYREQHKTKVQCPNCLKTLLSSNLDKHMLTRTCKTYYVEQYFRTTYAFDDCINEEYNLHYIE